jgi:ribosomal protein L30E
MNNQEFQHFLELSLIEVMNYKMQTIQFGSIVNLIQMKLMKVIHNLKNMNNQEFQHFLELSLIEVMNYKMQTIQFVSIVNLIQMKLMKGIDTMKNRMNQEFEQSKESILIEVMNLKNAFDSIRINREFDSNTMNKSF